MNFKKIAAAMMAAVCMANTVAFAENDRTGMTRPFSVKKNKGTYLFTEAEFKDLNKAMKNGDIVSDLKGSIFSCTLDTSSVTLNNIDMFIFDENSSFSIADNSVFDIEQIFLVMFEWVDIQKDEKGNSTFVSLGTSDFTSQYKPIWEIDGSNFYSVDLWEDDTLNAKELLSWGDLNVANSGDADMVIIHFLYGEKDVPREYKFIGDYSTIVPVPEQFIDFFEIVLTESGAAMLKEANVATVAPEAPSSLKATPKSTTSIKLSWKDNGADSYNIYRSTSKNGTYKKIASAEKNTYTNSKLTKGKTYYYKVTSVVGGEESELSKASSAKATAPTPSSVKASKAKSGSAEITWNKSTGANGYEVYMATSSDGKYSKVKTVNSKKLSYTKSKLTAGKTYYFKVRSYSQVDGKKVYSPFSKVVKVKV